MRTRLYLAACTIPLLFACGAAVDGEMSPDDASDDDVSSGPGDAVGRTEQPIYLSDVSGGSPTQFWTENHNEVPICFTSASMALFTVQRGWIESALNATWEAESGLNITFRDCPTSGTGKFLKVELVHRM
jgi:hypothetical protein